MHTGERARGRVDPRGVAIRRLAGAVAATVLCLSAAAAQAQSGKGDYIGGWSVAGGVGYAVPNTDEYANALAWRFGLGYQPNPRFEVGLELGRFATEVTQPELDGVPTHDIASGELEVRPVCLTLQLRTPLPESMASFVLLAGAGYYFIDYTMDAAAQEVLAAGGTGQPDQNVSDTWGFHAGAALEYALSGWFSLTLEGRYLFLAPDVSGTAKDNHTIGGSLDLNTWLFTGGIKVAF